MRLKNKARAHEMRPSRQVKVASKHFHVPLTEFSVRGANFGGIARRNDVEIA